MSTKAINSLNKVKANLSKTSKLPCFSYGLPALECITGSKLRQIKNSTCSKCYAYKGMYVWPAVKKAQYDRLAHVKQDSWVSDMTETLLKKEKSGFFRWHDSGDLQSLSHFEKIIQVCINTPNIQHWLPTRERKIVESHKGNIPQNLTIRLSSTMIDALQDSTKFNTSTVHKTQIAFGFECNAPKQEGKCMDCRACWDKKVKNISYKQH